MRRLLVLALAAVVAAVVLDAAIGDNPEHGAGLRFERLGQAPTWRTVLKSPFVLEGLTAGKDGALYTTLRDKPGPCEVVRVSPANADPTAGFQTVGLVPQPCSPSGLAFGPDGVLYVTGEGAAKDTLVRLVP